MKKLFTKIKDVVVTGATLVGCFFLLIFLMIFTKNKDWDDFDPYDYY